MKIFLKTIFRFLLIGLFPLLILFAGYIYLDPFKVLRHYNYYSNFHVITNREYISTEMFLRNRNKYQYNSFLFGSSRTLAFRVSSWKKHLKPSDHPFAFDASAENIYGIYTKLRFLDSLHQKIENVLVIIDRDGTFRASLDSMGHLYIRHPLISGSNRLNFQYSFFKAYLHPKFLSSFYMYTYGNQFKPFMTNCISQRNIAYDTITNEIDLSEIENEIRADSNRYYTKMRTILYDRKGETIDTVSKIKGQYLMMVDSICEILRRNNTNFKIIIGPVYDEVRFSEEDMNILREKFKNHLYDFSGKNYFTAYKGHYYETNHFRPSVGDSIFKIVYR